MKILPLAALLLVAAAPPPAPISAERIKADVRTLSSDAFAGRGPGEPGETATVELIGPGQTDLEAELRRAAAAGGQRVFHEPRPEAGWYFRSDHFPFAQRGVPALAFRAGRDLVRGGYAAGDQIVATYNRVCYHQPCDEFDPRWTFAGTAQEATAAFRVGQSVANSKGWPSWLAGSEYAPIRFASERERR